MRPVKFPEANAVLNPPNDLDESQCSIVPVYHGEVRQDSCDGVKIIVVAWKPDPRELEALKEGGLIFLTCPGGVPAHFLTVSFEAAIRPA